jgi:hypothetical protein
VPTPATFIRWERLIVFLTFSLVSVAQSLSQVVKKMGTINEQLNGLSESNNEVKEVADLWRESFATSRSGSESSSLSLSQSRDLNYCFP